MLLDEPVPCLHDRSTVSTEITQQMRQKDDSNFNSRFVLIRRELSKSASTYIRLARTNRNVNRTWSECKLVFFKMPKKHKAEKGLGRSLIKDRFGHTKRRTVDNGQMVISRVTAICNNSYMKTTTTISYTSPYSLLDPHAGAAGRL